jgi:dGTPase
MIYTAVNSLKSSRASSWRRTACAAKTRKGPRSYPEDEPEHRTRFQRDRDRILHTTAFRRLEYKTQVFINYEGDYYRTRLTHTLEVAQIGRTIALALGANEDLTEAICLAHDLGHPPFGHSGETILSRLMRDQGGFDHNKQSFRIVTELERRYPNFPG